jgi:hypothetical protein
MENLLTPFSKDELLDELRTIFLFEADHILLGAGEEAAAHFIGFPVGGEGEYFHEAPRKVDLSRFQIAGSFDRGYDYAFRPSILNHLGEHEPQDLVVFMLGVPRTGGISSGGETHRFMTPDGYCQMVADAVQARWKLEWDSAGTAGNEFTPRELALLANMTEGAVRNAIADKSENRLHPISGTKNPIRIRHDEAWRWLSGRRGFIPSPKRPSEDRFLTEYLRDLQSSERLGDLLSRRLRDVYGSPQRASSALGWSEDEINQWMNGSFQFDAERAGQLAQTLELDVPFFVGKALEVSLRRNRLPEKHE